VIAAELRDERTALLTDASVRGRAFGAALAHALDDALKAAYEDFAAAAGVALLALGSYGRRELCPGSDVDVLLVRASRGGPSADDFRVLAERLWYPLWDAGFVSGHGARTLKESLALANENLEALTAMLEVRLIAGDAELAAELERKVRDLAVRRSERMLHALADAAATRRIRPGPVAEMLEPDLKEGAGGLRDVQSLTWAGWAFGSPGGTSMLVQRGTLAPTDLDRVAAARELLLDARVALQRNTASRSDRLALQEQDAVAHALTYADADLLVRDLAAAAREVAWIVADVWNRVRDALSGPVGRIGRADVPLADGVLLRDQRVHIQADADGSVPARRALEAAAAAADRGASFDRTSLARLQAVTPPSWDLQERTAFLQLLRAGRNAVPVFEALDHEGVLVSLLPEWQRVRSLPQRNAYHRFTVDRHLLETVAQCASLIDDKGQPRTSHAEFDTQVARSCRHPELLLLGALLHDMAKGLPGDHSDAGAELASNVTRRLGLDHAGREIVAWLVRNHLLMADVATRRDLSDASVADSLAAACEGDVERLKLLYLLTIGDSLATGPAAWGPSKAVLVRDLFMKATAAIERGEARVLSVDRRRALEQEIGTARAAAFLSHLPDSYPLAFDDARMLAHEEMLRAGQAVRCENGDGSINVTVVVADRPGLLATLAGAFTVCGVDVVEAHVFGTTDGLALDVFDIVDTHGRLANSHEPLEQTIEAVLAGSLDLEARVAERRQGYVRAGDQLGPTHVDIRDDISQTDTVVEVHTDNSIGLLYQLAKTFIDRGIDLRVAKVATLGQRVVDVFYVRDAAGHKLDDHTTNALRAALTASATQ